MLLFGDLFIPWGVLAFEVGSLRDVVSFIWVLPLLGLEAQCQRQSSARKKETKERQEYASSAEAPCVRF